MAVGIVNKEELIFNIHKNDSIEDTIKYKKELSKNYGLSDNEAHDMFVKIVNYQIDKYGCQIQKYNDYVSRDDYFTKHRRSLQRTYGRIRRNKE